MATRRRDRFHARRGFWARGNKVRRTLTWVLIGASALTVLLIVAYYQLLAHLQSPDFCRSLSEHAKNALQAEQVTLRDTLQIDGSRITLGEASAVKAGSVEKAAARGISLEIDRGALWDRCLTLRKLAIEEAEIHLAFAEPRAHKASKTTTTPKKNKKQPAQPPTQHQVTETPHTAPNSGSSGFINNFIPNQFSLHNFECKDSDAHLQLGDSRYSLHACTASATPQKKLGSNTWQINLENGRFHTPFSFLRDTSVKNATIIASPKEINLVESRLLLTPGELRVRGSYTTATKRWSAVLRANKANVARILNEDWKKRLQGELYGELELAGKGNELTRSAGYMSLQKGVLEGLPILSQIPIGDTYPYRSLPLEKAECRLSFPYNAPGHNLRNAWLMDQIDVRASNGLLMVQGHIIIGSDKSLGGTLRIGLPASRLALSQIPTISKLFEPEDEHGILWLKLNLSGTLDHPQEDLSIRIATIMGQALPQLPGNAVQGLNNAINNIFSHPRQQEDKAPATPQEPEKPSSPLDSAGNLFKNTLQSFF